MTAIINYLLEANLVLMVVLITYRLLFYRENNFAFMRLFLVAGIVFSIVGPLISLKNFDSIIPTASALIPSYWLPEIVITGNNRYTIQPTESFSTWKFLEVVYWIGLGVFLGRFLYGLTMLSRIIKNASFVTLGKLKLAVSSENMATFSFFNTIFIGNAESLSEDEKQDIINHESIHVKQFHSLDIILIRIVQILFWFNPFIRNYQRYLVELHEFEADARAVENSELNRYCSLLARVALQSADFSIANHFNNSLTLKRITMIRTIKRKISNWKILTASSMFPLLLFLIGFQDQVIAQQQKVQPPQSSDNSVYDRVDEMPTYDGGFEHLVQFLSSNMKYPKTARENKLEGTVYVKLVVEKDGKVTDINLAKGVEPSMDAEALRVVRLMPAWNPGLVKGQAVRTAMVLPIKFKLN